MIFGAKMHIQEISDFLIFLEDEFKLLEEKMHGRVFKHKIDKKNNEVQSVSFPHFVGEKKGIPLEIDFYNESEDYLSPSLKIYIKLTSTPFILSLKQEDYGFLNAISKRLGLLQDIEVGISSLDNNLIIQSDSPDKVKKFLLKKNVEQSILKLGNFSSIEFSDNSIKFLDAPFSNKSFSKDYLKDTIEALISITSEYVKNEQDDAIH